MLSAPIKLGLCVLWSSFALAAPSPLVQRIEGREISSGRALERRQNAGVVGADVFYRRGYHASTLVGQRLFIDGGEYSYLSEGTVKFAYEPNTLVLDLSRSWSPATVNFSVIPKPSGAPILNYPTLWYNAARRELLQGFAGAVSPWPNTTLSATDLSLWSLKLDDPNANSTSNDTAGVVNGAWTEVLYTRHGAFGALTRPVDGLAAFGGDSAFVLGGYASRETAPSLSGDSGRTPLPGLVHYNMTSATFANLTASEYYGTGSAQRGQMVFVPGYGAQGLFVMLGGDSVLPNGKGYRPGSRLLSFANVTLFDAATRRWYWQTARGDVPRPRIEFCAAGARSTNGTYEIFVYGGWGSNLGTVAVSYDELFVLSLPAFRWFRAPYAARRPRHAHTCHVVGQRHLLSVGGVDTTQDKPLPGGGAHGLDLATFTTRDTHPQGLALFDMTLLNWTTRYEAGAAPYEQSAAVASFYRTSSRYPPSWDNDMLQPLMMESAGNRPPPPGPGDKRNSTASTSGDDKREKNGLAPGAVAGIVVGSVAASALLVTLFTVMFLRRRHRQKQSTDPSRSSSSSPRQSSSSASPGTAAACYDGSGSGVVSAPELQSPQDRLAWEMPAGGGGGAGANVQQRAMAPKKGPGVAAAGTAAAGTEGVPELPVANGACYELPAGDRGN